MCVCACLFVSFVFPYSYQTFCAQLWPRCTPVALLPARDGLIVAARWCRATPWAGMSFSAGPLEGPGARADHASWRRVGRTASSTSSTGRVRRRSRSRSPVGMGAPPHPADDTGCHARPLSARARLSQEPRPRSKCLQMEWDKDGEVLAILQQGEGVVCAYCRPRNAWPNRDPSNDPLGACFQTCI